MFTTEEKYWIFKLEDEKRNFLINQILNQEIEFFIQYEVKSILKKEFNGKVLFLYFDKNIKEWVFQYVGDLTKYEFIKDPDKNLIFFKATFENVKPYGNIMPLETVKYSLKTIKNFKNPERNINFYLNTISRVEYDAIVLGEIYYSRTVFYKLFQSLPYDHKLSFYKRIFNLNPYSTTLLNDCGTLLKELEDYIEMNIFQSAQLLLAAYEILKKFVQEDDLSKIGFDKANKNHPVDNLISQVEATNQFIKSYQERPKKKEIEEEYKDFVRTEAKFKNIFKGVPVINSLR